MFLKSSLAPFLNPSLMRFQKPLPDHRYKFIQKRHSFPLLHQSPSGALGGDWGKPPLPGRKLRGYSGAGGEKFLKQYPNLSQIALMWKN